MLVATIIVVGVWCGIIGYLIGCMTTQNYFLDHKDKESKEDKSEDVKFESVDSEVFEELSVLGIVDNNRRAG